MSSHVHMIIGRQGEESLEGIVRDIKKFTSSKIISAIKCNQQQSRKELFLWLFEPMTGASLPALICAMAGLVPCISAVFRLFQAVPNNAFDIVIMLR